MAEILVRGVDDGVLLRLKKRAKREGRSLQAEVRMILEQAAKVDADAAREALEKFRKRFRGRKFSDSVELLREDRDR